jgi:hypothetical protein
LSTAVETDELLSKRIVPPLWQEDGPEIVIHSTDKNARVSLAPADKMGRGCLHCDSGHCVRGIPEADVASVLASRWGIPGHDDKVELDADVEDDHCVPGFELGLREVCLLATPTDNVDPKRHC